MCHAQGMPGQVCHTQGVPGEVCHAQGVPGEVCHARRCQMRFVILVAGHWKPLLEFDGQIRGFEVILVSSPIVSKAVSLFCHFLLGK